MWGIEEVHTRHKDTLTPVWPASINNIRAFLYSTCGVMCHFKWKIIGFFLTWHTVLFFYLHLHYKVLSNNKSMQSPLMKKQCTERKNTHQKCCNVFPTEHMSVTFGVWQPPFTEQTEESALCGLMLCVAHIVRDEKLLTYNNEVKKSQTNPHGRLWIVFHSTKVWGARLGFSIWYILKCKLEVCFIALVIVSPTIV